jgi:hypothetical protein
MKRIVAAVLALVVLTPSAKAATITFSTSDNRFEDLVDNQGWWSDSQDGSTTNANYFTGRQDSHLANSFFTFDLSSLDLTSQVITAATLSLPGFWFSSSDDSETLGLFDVSTNAAVLNANNGTNATIFEDLGTGTSYGSFVIARYDQGQTLTLALNRRPDRPHPGSRRFLLDRRHPALPQQRARDRGYFRRQRKHRQPVADPRDGAGDSGPRAILDPAPWNRRGRADGQAPPQGAAAGALTHAAEAASPSGVIPCICR